MITANHRGVFVGSTKVGAGSEPSETKSQPGAGSRCPWTGGCAVRGMVHRHGSASAHLRHQHQKRILTLVRSSFLNPHNTIVGQRHKIKGVPPPFHSLSFPTHLRPSFNYVHKRNATSERTGLKRNRCKTEGLESIN